MKILFDHCVTTKLRPFLVGHEVVRAYELGWSEISNGTLLTQAEQAGFEVVLTVDGNISSQQNMEGRRVAVLILEAVRSSIEYLEPLVPDVLRALPQLMPGEIRVVRSLNSDAPAESPE